MFEKTLPFSPFDLYIKGDMLIYYMLNQHCLVSTQPVVKCDIIDADNALKLQKTDMLYLYKPTSISNEIINDKEYYKMVYEIPNDYYLIECFKFKFKEFCFGNTWELEWQIDDINTDRNKGHWEGNNLRGRLAGNIVNKLNKRNINYYHNDNRTHLCYVMMKNDEIHNEIIDRGEHGILYSFYELANKEGKIATKILLNNNEVIDGETNHVQCIVFQMGGHNKETYEGYDLVGVECRLLGYEENVVKFNELIPKISRIYLDIYLPKSSTPTRLTFQIKPEILHVYGQANANVDLIGDKDTIERIACYWKDSHINTDSRHIELYLRKSMTDPIEEINWNPQINPFEYIINQQYYEIYPNPNAATTLYTDYNICSSKIITADNITTMRSDLNVVANNFDVLSYDVGILRLDVNKLQMEMLEQQYITQHLQADMKSVKIMSGITLAFTIGTFLWDVAGTLLSDKGVNLGRRAIHGNDDVSHYTSLDDLCRDYGSTAPQNVRLETAGTIQRVVGSVEDSATRLNGYWSQFRELLRDLDRWDGNNAMVDIVFEQIGDLTNTIYEEFPNAIMPEWLRRLLKERGMRRSVVTQSDTPEPDLIPKVIEWCETDYQRLDDPEKFEDNWINPEKAVLSLSATVDVCNRMRESMKLPIGILAHELSSVKEKVNKKHPLDDINMDEYIKKSEVEELLMAYDNRIKALEAKCANIE